MSEYRRGNYVELKIIVLHPYIRTERLCKKKLHDGDSYKVNTVSPILSQLFHEI
jgi:hypothetical protein